MFRIRIIIIRGDKRIVYHATNEFETEDEAWGYANNKKIQQEVKAYIDAMHMV